MLRPPGALLTDLYQLTMMQAYYEHGLEDTAVFEFFVRRLPENRGFLLAAGLEQVLDYLESLRFTRADLDWIAGSRYFSQAFAERLADFRFTGDVHAMPEGTAFFPDEPVLRVTATLPEAQLVESRILNLMHFQTVIASKAARCVLAAPGKVLVDFGMRRAHGAEAGLLAGRANYIAGFTGTSAVEAAPAFGIPVFGTMAHSFIEVHDDETQAFERFALSHPDNVTLLIDTYDTEKGAQKVVELAPRLREQGVRIKGVRLDSGDLADHAFKVRKILDDGGCSEITIFASGSLDEFVIEDMLERGAPIDGFGIGTRLDTSKDAPYLDCAYKLMEYAGIPRRKRSEGKATLPGRKQVYRRFGADGRMERDFLTVADDTQAGEKLLCQCMRDGKRVGAQEPLSAIRERAARSLSILPESCRKLRPGKPYPVEISAALRAVCEETDRRMP
ncbi:MAG: nicotinate phosphoribosyltransferase [Lysobacterales bacterium]|jgi:nicotinate phosphoribosyltransferase